MSSSSETLRTSARAEVREHSSGFKAHPHTAQSGCHWQPDRAFFSVKVVISQKLVRFHLDNVWFFGISNKKYIR